METVQKRPHSLSIDGRTRGTVSGVDKVISSNETTLLLDTSEGTLTIVGKDFKIKKFSAEDGILAFEGVVDSFRYSASKGGSLVKRLFK